MGSHAHRAATAALSGSENRRALAAAYYVAFAALGLLAGGLGPTLPGLATQASVGLGQISILLTAYGLGYATGSLLSGRVYDRVSGHRIMAAALFLMAAGIAALPVLGLLWLLTAVVFVVAAAAGGLDVGGNTLLIWAYGRQVSGVMNGLHLFFGIGALLAPFVVAQVILLTGRSPLTYLVLAPLMLPAALWLLRLRSPASPPATDTITGRIDWLLVALFALFNIVSVGAESTYGNWIFTYGTRLGLVTEAGGAYLTSVFWGAFSLGRLAAVFASARFSPAQIMLVCVPGAAAGALLILAFPASVFALWLGTAVFGFAFGPIFPAVLAQLGQSTRVTGLVSSVIFLGSSLGMMSVPWVVGQLIEPAGPAVVMLTAFATTTLAIFVLVAALLRSRNLHAAALAAVE